MPLGGGIGFYLGLILSIIVFAAIYNWVLPGYSPEEDAQLINELREDILNKKGETGCEDNCNNHYNRLALGLEGFKGLDTINDVLDGQILQESDCDKKDPNIKSANGAISMSTLDKQKISSTNSNLDYSYTTSNKNTERSKQKEFLQDLEIYIYPGSSCDLKMQLNLDYDAILYDDSRGFL